RGGQRSTRSDKRGGRSERRRAVPRREGPRGGQRSTRSDKRGGRSERRRAVPRREGPRGGQGRTRSDKRGGRHMTAWIKMIPLEEASGTLKEMYALAKTPAGTVDNVMRAHSLRPH